MVDRVIRDMLQEIFNAATDGGCSGGTDRDQLRYIAGLASAAMIAADVVESGGDAVARQTNRG